jgi:hypothetical protein
LAALRRGFMRNTFSVDISSPGRWNFLRTVLIVAGLLALCSPLLAESPCTATVKARVEVAGEGFSLADLLAPGTCPALLRAADGMRLGATPRAGSVRVFEKDDIQEYFAELRKRAGNGARVWGTVSVPERIVVRRAGSGTSCKRIVENLIATLRSAQAGRSESGNIGALDPSKETVDCGAVSRIPQDAILKATKTAWDAASRSWKISARCERTSDCVPFLVRVRASNTSPNALAGLVFSSQPIALEPVAEKPLVPAGAKVMLVWEKDAIRAMVPAIALDSGDAGEAVRARIARSGYVVHAVVVGAGMIRTSA